MTLLIPLRCCWDNLASFSTHNRNKEELFESALEQRMKKHYSPTFNYNELHISAEIKRCQDLSVFHGRWGLFNLLKIVTGVKPELEQDTVSRVKEHATAWIDRYIISHVEDTGDWENCSSGDYMWQGQSLGTWSKKQYYYSKPDWALNDAVDGLKSVMEEIDFDLDSSLNGKFRKLQNYLVDMTLHFGNPKIAYETYKTIEEISGVSSDRVLINFP